MCFIVGYRRTPGDRKAPKNVVAWKVLRRMIGGGLHSKVKATTSGIWIPGKIKHAHSDQYFDDGYTGAGIYVYLTFQKAQDNYSYGCRIVEVRVDPKDFLFKSHDDPIATYKKVYLYKSAAKDLNLDTRRRANGTRFAVRRRKQSC